MLKYILRSDAINLSNKTNNSQKGHNENNSLNKIRQKTAIIQTKQIVIPVDRLIWNELEKSKDIKITSENIDVMLKKS